MFHKSCGEAPVQLLLCDVCRVAGSAMKDVGLATHYIPSNQLHLLEDKLEQVRDCRTKYWDKALGQSTGTMGQSTGTKYWDKVLGQSTGDKVVGQGTGTKYCHAFASTLLGDRKLLFEHVTSMSSNRNSCNHRGSSHLLLQLRM
jgi:hypothetical protein